MSSRAGYDARIAERRKYNAAERRQDLADAGIELLGVDGSRGLTHGRVDRHAGVPEGTTSFYFRSRQALLHGIALRLNELDVAELSKMEELTHGGVGDYAGTMGLARLVMLSGTEPYLTRSRARFELLLCAHHDPELNTLMAAYGAQFYVLARDVIAHWHDTSEVSDAAVEEPAMVVLTFISGVMTSFINGFPVVTDAGHLDRLIRQILAGSGIDTT